jgi:hypothetical protein
MYRSQPPLLATWMLEHLTPQPSDEALVGDLLENFHRGRSSAWYWLQVLRACRIAWFRSLRARLPLIVFAGLWSALAPAWAVLAERTFPDLGMAQALNDHWPLALAKWMILNSAFLWAGILVYTASSAKLRIALPRQRAGRALLFAPALFLPAYGATFVVTNLLWYPGLGVNWHTLKPLAEIVDLRIRANALRIPYLIAMIAALWGAIPDLRGRREVKLTGAAPLDVSPPSGSLWFESLPDPFTLGRFITLTVAAGLVNAMIASLLLWRLPEVKSPGLGSLSIRALFSVMTGALAGVGGSWFYWSKPASPLRANAPLPFSHFALVSAAAWIWVPSLVLFSAEVSAAAAFVAMVGAWVLASGLRRTTGSIFAPAGPAPALWESDRAELFQASLSRPAIDGRGYLIAIALYLGGWALTRHLNSTAALLLALSAFLFSWERTAPEEGPLDGSDSYQRSARRLALWVIPAVVVTMWALIDGIVLGEPTVGVDSAPVRATSGHTPRNNSAGGQAGISGFESIILWPVPERRKIVAPLAPEASLRARGWKQPLVLRFNGSYWFYQPPDRRPGPDAHQAHGTPLDVRIRANNSLPLLMAAHQNLSASIPVAGLSEIDVEIENRDPHPSAMNLAMLIEDSAAPHRPALYLGQQPVRSSEPGPWRAGLTAAHERLRFFFPKIARLQRFNEITVLFLPGFGDLEVAPKIALEDFSMIPR